MDDRQQQDHEREERLERLPEHERDRTSDTMGGGILSQGGTATERGTDAGTGLAGAGRDDLPADDRTTTDPTPGISDYTDPVRESDDPDRGSGERHGTDWVGDEA